MLKNIKWGAWLGIQIGIGFTVLAVLFTTLSVSLPGPDAAPIPLVKLITLYLAGGLVSGSIVGILRPLLATRMGANLVSVIAAVPIYGALRVLAVGLIPWSRFDFFLISFCAIIGGTVVSQLIWRQNHRAL